jgi:hypothetical protein
MLARMFWQFEMIRAVIAVIINQRPSIQLLLKQRSDLSQVCPLSLMGSVYGSPGIVSILLIQSVCVAADVNEVLLVDDRGAVEEGMSSNFFAVANGVVYTADEGVLKGTVRELVLQVCVVGLVVGTEHTPDIRFKNKFGMGPLSCADSIHMSIPRSRSRAKFFRSEVFLFLSKRLQVIMEPGHTIEWQGSQTFSNDGG